MFRILSCLIACFVLGVVLFGLSHERCRQAILIGTVGGLMIGVVHAVLHVYCIIEVYGRRLNTTRIRRIVIHDVRMDLVIGLLVGCGSAVVDMCKQ